MFSLPPIAQRHPMGPSFLIKLLLDLGYRTRYRFTLLYNGIILLTKLQDLKILLSYPLLAPLPPD